MLSFFCRISLILLLPLVVSAQVDYLVIGQGGLPWNESNEQLIGLTDTVFSGSLQPVELDTSVNFVVGPRTESGQFTTIFGGIWDISSTAPPHVQDLAPYVYGSRGRAQTVDGDGESPTDVTTVEHYTFDMGLALPINRVVFYAPEKGRTTTRGSSGLLLKDLYPRQYAISSSLNEREFLFKHPRNNFDNVVAQSLNHSTRVADVRFPTTFARFMRVRFPTRGFIAELEFYGEGFAPFTSVTSQLFDMGEPVNFGRLLYDFETYRTTGFGSEPVLAPDAPVKIAVEVRSGRDNTPLVYHITTELGTERVVEFKTWDRAPEAAGASSDAVRNRGKAPGQKGSVQDDLANWSFWSAPHTASGEPIQAPDARQFVQVRAYISSEEVFAFGRLNSLSIEYSPLLANPVLGEVALVEEPQPESGVVEVPLGERVTLTYDVRADFTSDLQTGFDAVRLRTPDKVDFQRFEMGDPLVAVEPDSLLVEDRELVVYFPSRSVSQADNVPLRLTFGTRVFNFNTVFEGEVFQIEGKNLAQSIDGGDASSLVSTNGLQVFAPLEQLTVLSELESGAGVLTPNGDGVNDGLELSYTLQGILAAEVEVEIYDLGGRLVWQVASEVRGEGKYTDVWDGRDARSVVAPGLYLARVSVGTDLGVFEKTRTIAVAY